MPGEPRRLLITGASGDLGRPLSALASQSWRTLSTFYRNPAVGGGQPVRLDLRDRAEALAVATQFHPHVIIHAAVSDRSDDMAATNREAARSVVSAAQATGARLMALSTDMVFDGTRPPYSEDALPAPRTEYGAVKAENEAFFLREDPRCLIIRTSLIYDFAPPNRQAGWLLEEVTAGRRVPLFVDEVRSPIWSWNLAGALLELAEMDVAGILHVAGPQPVTRWGLGAALLEELGFDPQTAAVPALAEDVAPHRPRNLVLHVGRARDLLVTPLLPLPTARERARAARSHG